MKLYLKTTKIIKNRFSPNQLPNQLVRLHPSSGPLSSPLIKLTILARFRRLRCHNRNTPRRTKHDEEDGTLPCLNALASPPGGAVAPGPFNSLGKKR
ncbi:hypothetical protein Agabi119p4_10156 [Agaricus bisporus var. burnettii]|uniref:Uncharacterized protein n=1 Tax=Agaricus bisporus var. burnettii TaxID=192524 RepID=A0A8H7C1T7_AGABI|nr:hypothetical protein Agabi119p4_10156 [Agaricus bisporus var. burnettii]